MNYMINKIVAIQGDHPSKLNPVSDTSIFLANEAQNKNYKIFYYEPKDLSRKGLENRDVLSKKGNNETVFLNHLQKVIDNKTTNADHMISKFSKNENLDELYDK